MPTLNMSLFLSANEEDVRKAVEQGWPAGQVVASAYTEDNSDELRIAFDFDGVLADDESERVMQSRGLEQFHRYEATNAVTPLNPGPLRDFLANVNKIQKYEEKRRSGDRDYSLRLRVSIVTSRDAPAHERAVMSLKKWGVTANDAFFLGGINKGTVLEVLRPHIFFDDQKLHLESTARVVPSVHVPFGVANQTAPATSEADPGLQEMQ
jgi:5'-nucleotidase